MATDPVQLSLDARKQELRRQMLDALLVLMKMEGRTNAYKAARDFITLEAVARSRGNQSKASRLVGTDSTRVCRILKRMRK